MLGELVSGGAPGRGDRRGDLAVGEAGRPGGRREVGEHRLVSGLGGAAGGPEQAVVAVALVLLGHPGGEAAQIPAVGRWRAGRATWRLRFEQAVTLSQSRPPRPGLVPDEPVGLAADLGRRGEDVAALRRGSRGDGGAACRTAGRCR